MKMDIQLKITDDGKKLLKRLKELEKVEVAVGYQAGKSEEKDGTDICQVATWNEFGTSKIPARPFMRDGINNNQREIQNHVTREAKGIINGTVSPQEFLSSCGVNLKGQIQKEIRHGEFAPNAPSTIARKGSDKPLIDTGRMRQSVDFVIRPKGA